MEPVSGRYKRWMREMMVDLPQPLGPTKATDLLTGMVKETSLRMGESGYVVYVKETLEKVMSSL